MRTICSLPILAVLFLGIVVRAEATSAPPGPDAKADVSSPGVCRLAGVSAPELGATITDQSGKALARFGGVPVPLILSDLPEQADGRFRVITGASGRVQVEGFVDAKTVPLYARSDLTVVAGQVSIAKGARVEFAGRRGDQVLVKLTASSPLADTFEATVPCSAITLDSSKIDAGRIPGQARGYFMKAEQVTLLDAPGEGAQVKTTLHRASDVRGVLLFGDRRQGDYVHVLYRQDAKIEGWVSSKELELLPRGELVDQKSLKPVVGQASRLSVASDARPFRAPSDMPLFGRADPKLSPIGVVPKNTELYVLDVVVGWVNVLPKQLDVVPLEERRFWVRASELGI